MLREKERDKVKQENIAQKKNSDEKLKQSPAKKTKKIMSLHPNSKQND